MSYHHWLTLGHFEVRELLTIGWSAISAPVSVAEVLCLQAHHERCFGVPVSLEKFLLPAGVVTFSYFSERLSPSKRPDERNYGIGYLAHAALGLSGVLAAYNHVVHQDEVMFPPPAEVPVDVDGMKNRLRKLMPNFTEPEIEQRISRSIEAYQRGRVEKGAIQRVVDQYLATCR